MSGMAVLFVSREIVKVIADVHVAGLMSLAKEYVPPSRRELRASHVVLKRRRREACR